MNLHKGNTAVSINNHFKCLMMTVFVIAGTVKWITFKSFLERYVAFKTADPVRFSNKYFGIWIITLTIISHSLTFSVIFSEVIYFWRDAFHYCRMYLVDAFLICYVYFTQKVLPLCNIWNSLLRTMGSYNLILSPSQFPPHQILPFIIFTNF